MKKNLCLLIAATTISMPQAFAVTQNFKVDLSTQHSRGQQEIPIKRVINGKYGRGLLKGYKLEKVVLSAKSKNGRGDANLAIGHSETYPEQIPGTPEAFASNSEGFHRVVLNASTQGQPDRAPWKVHLKGNIKLNSLKAVTKYTPTYPYSRVNALNFTKVKDFKVNKVIPEKERINVGNKFKAIQLTATGKVRVTKVKVKFADGQVVYLDELEGKVRGKTSFKFNNELAKKVKFIEVSAVSTNLFGSRGHLQIFTANKRNSQTRPTRPTRPNRPSRPRR